LNLKNTATRSPWLLELSREKEEEAVPESREVKLKSAPRPGGHVTVVALTGVRPILWRHAGLAMTDRE
jgi:hypothetical protein